MRTQSFSDPRCPCPFCGGTTFTAGRLQGSDRSTLEFVADGVPFFDRLGGLGKAPVMARVCHNCRHLDLFAPDFEAEPGSHEP